MFITAVNISRIGVNMARNLRISGFTRYEKIINIIEEIMLVT